MYSHRPYYAYQLLLFLYHRIHRRTRLEDAYELPVLWADQSILRIDPPLSTNVPPIACLDHAAHLRGRRKNFLPGNCLSESLLITWLQI